MIKKGHYKHISLETSLKEAWKAVRVRDETINVTVKKLQNENEILRQKVRNI